MKDKIKIILIIGITIFCLYKIINWVISPIYAVSTTSSWTWSKTIVKKI